jgi:hypothetical protein
MPMIAGPCHHGMARPQVADGGTAYNMEGSCEYTDYAAADNRQGVVLRLGGWVVANILNTRPRTAGKGWSSGLVVGRGAKNSP